MRDVFEFLRGVKTDGMKDVSPLSFPFPPLSMGAQGKQI